MSETCEISVCVEPAIVINLCSFHYKRQWKLKNGISTLPVDAPKIKFRTVCSVEDCDKPHKCKGFCQMHYRRYTKYGDPSITRWEPKPVEGTCEAFGCKAAVKNQGLCVGHYDIQVKRKWDPREPFECYICGKYWAEWPLDKSIAFDHVVPGEEETRPVCRGCNLSKSDKIMKELLDWCEEVLSQHGR
jgi:hypothetical protein